MAVHIGDVSTYAHASCSRAQALKVVEEASEVFSAVEVLAAVTNEPSARGGLSKVEAVDLYRAHVIEEAADAITALCGLLESMGVRNMQPHMEACKLYNESLGRDMV